jgi:hypothetical protein
MQIPQLDGDNKTPSVIHSFSAQAYAISLVHEFIQLPFSSRILFWTFEA